MPHSALLCSPLLCSALCSTLLCPALPSASVLLNVDCSGVTAFCVHSWEVVGGPALAEVFRREADVCCLMSDVCCVDARLQYVLVYFH